MIIIVLAMFLYLGASIACRACIICQVRLDYCVVEFESCSACYCYCLIAILYAFVGKPWWHCVLVALQWLPAILVLMLFAVSLSISSYVVLSGFIVIWYGCMAVCRVCYIPWVWHLLQLQVCRWGPVSTSSMWSYRISSAYTVSVLDQLGLFIFVAVDVHDLFKIYDE